MRSAWNRDFLLLAFAVLMVGGFVGVLFTLYNNFIVERVGIEAHELGVIEALREVPGLLNAFIIAMLITVVPARFACWSLVILGLGIIGFTQVDSVFTLALFSVIWSIGFHCWIPLESAMALTFSEGSEKGRVLGQLRSISGFGGLAAIVLCLFAFRYVGYEGLFALAGAATIIGGAGLLFTTRRANEVREEPFVFKRRFRYFYVLQILQGCRKQMFITFAIFALVKVHQMPVETTIVLVLVNQVVVMVTAPLLGRLVDRFGERRMLSASYIGLFFVFLGYAFVKDRPVLYVLYCVDNAIFFGGIALTTYLHRIATPEELRPSLSMGVTMNHVASVAAPLIGGYVWYLFGYEVIFLAGAGLCLVSLVVTQRMERF